MKDAAASHQRAIALKTLKYTCLGARAMGGMDHVEARRFLARQGRAVDLPDDCQCWRRHVGEEATR